MRDILQSTPGVDIVGSISGLNFLTNAAQSNSAVEFAILKPWDERPPEQSASQHRRRRCARSCSAIPDAFALSFDPPSIPGLGATGGFEFQVEDLTGRGSVALNEATQALIAEARKQPETQCAAAVLVVQHLDAAVQLRPRPQQGEAARASTCPTCSTRCRSISARSTSTTSTCSAAPSA